LRRRELYSHLEQLALCFLRSFFVRHRRCSGSCIGVSSQNIVDV
jgi:hypothetical protein